MFLFEDTLLTVVVVQVAMGIASGVGLWTWLSRWTARKKGLQPASLLRRLVSGFLLTLTVPILCTVIAPFAWPFIILAILIVIFCMVRPPRIPFWQLGLPVVLLYSLSIQTGVMLGLWRGRELAKRSADLSHLASIRCSLMLYYDEYQAYPGDLRQLVDSGQSPYILLSINSPSKEADPEQHPYVGPCDYTYIKLPPDAPPGLAWVWLSPDFHCGEVGYVLLSEGTVASMLPADMDALIHKTRAWLDSQAQLQAQSQPALN